MTEYWLKINDIFHICSSVALNGQTFLYWSRTYSRQMLPRHIWFMSHHQWTLSHGNTHGSWVKLNYRPHSTPPSVHLVLLLSLTHMHTSGSNVYQVCESAGRLLTNRFHAEQRSKGIKSLWLLSSPLPPSFLLAFSYEVGFTNPSWKRSVCFAFSL